MNNYKTWFKSLEETKNDINWMASNIEYCEKEFILTSAFHYLEEFEQKLNESNEIKKEFFNFMSIIKSLNQLIEDNKLEHKELVEKIELLQNKVNDLLGTNKLLIDNIDKSEEEDFDKIYFPPREKVKIENIKISKGKRAKFEPILDCDNIDIDELIEFLSTECSHEITVFDKEELKEKISKYFN